MEDGEVKMGSCLVGGHHFVQKGDELIDEAARNRPDAKRVRVRFDSLEYFELLARYPKVFPAFRGARRVTLAEGDTVYEVHH